MSDYIIPDIFTIVLEYSSYEDRKKWNYNIGNIYDKLSLTINNIHDVSRMVNIELGLIMLPVCNLPVLETLELTSQHICKLDLTNCSNLRILKLGYYFNQILDLRSNPMLTELHLGHRFNQPLDLSSQYNIDNLYLGQSFNHPIILNSTPRIIHTGHKYNHPLLQHSLLGIVELYLGPEFNQDLDFTNSPNLTTVYWGFNYNKTMYIRADGYVINYDKAIVVSN